MHQQREPYRRDVQGIRNLQEGRHALARKVCHGKGELHHRYDVATWVTKTHLRDPPTAHTPRG
jgi:TnpA family transposase